MIKCFKNAKVLSPLYTDERLVVVQDGKIAGVHNRLDISPEMEVIDAKGLYLSPGFIDIHVHGGGGCGVMGCSPDEIVKMCQAHAQHGTTSILPTTLAAPIPHLKRAIAAVKAAQAMSVDSNILGIHLEGPFLSKNQKGAQSEDSILVPTEENVRDLLDSWDGIKMVGAAPEVCGCLALGRELRRRNITASIAHSDARYDDVINAIEAGYSDVTHIFSGCSSVIRENGYRIAGVVEAGLLRDELSVQVIADLKHLPVSLLKLIYKCKGADKISLITDGLDYSATTLLEGTVYRQENGVETVYEDGVMKLIDRQAFAGSVATCNKLVYNMYKHADVPLLDAVKMATMTPARRVGVGHCKGLIAEGYDADILLFDNNIQIKMCMVSGKSIFSHMD